MRRGRGVREGGMTFLAVPCVWVCSTGVKVPVLGGGGGAAGEGDSEERRRLQVCCTDRTNSTVWLFIV